MLQNYDQLCRKFVLLSFCVLSFGGLSSGMLLCLVKSPQEKAGMYLSLAAQYRQQASVDDYDKAITFLKASEEAALVALSYTPYDESVWKALALTKEGHQALRESRTAKDLAFSSID